MYNDFLINDDTLVNNSFDKELLTEVKKALEDLLNYKPEIMSSSDEDIYLEIGDDNISDFFI